MLTITERYEHNKQMVCDDLIELIGEWDNAADLNPYGSFGERVRFYTTVWDMLKAEKFSDVSEMLTDIINEYSDYIEENLIDELKDIISDLDELSLYVGAKNKTNSLLAAVSTASAVLNAHGAYNIQFFEDKVHNTVCVSFDKWGKHSATYYPDMRWWHVHKKDTASVLADIDRALNSKTEKR